MKLALGTVQFGQEYGIANKDGKVSENQALSMINLASLSGIDTIDTAIAYGDSERCLGVIGVSDKKIITKLQSIPLKVLNTQDWIFNQVRDSLNRLNINSIYGLLLHDPDQLCSKKGEIIYKSLKKLQSEKIVEKIGISVYEPHQVIDAVKDYEIDIIQLPFNILDQRFRTSGLMHDLFSRGIEVHVRSIFLQGLLLMPYEQIPKKFLPWNNLFMDWHNWLKENSITPLEACISFGNSTKEIEKIVVGADNTNQLKQIIKATSISKIKNFPEISTDDMNLINPAKWVNL